MELENVSLDSAFTKKEIQENKVEHWLLKAAFNIDFRDTGHSPLKSI